MSLEELLALLTAPLRAARVAVAGEGASIFPMEVVHRVESGILFFHCPDFRIFSHFKACIPTKQMISKFQRCLF